jgi:phosphatidylethanolamine-binding protein (PEBP) family uncharacterized protein
MGDNALAHDPSVTAEECKNLNALLRVAYRKNPAIFGPSVGLHRYFFKLYALDSKLSLKASPAKAEAEKAMQGHILGQGELVGRYRR